MRTFKQFAYAMSGQRKGPWRMSEQDARSDALAAGAAARDEHYTTEIYLIIPATIITRDVEPPMDGIPVFNAFTRQKRSQFAISANGR